MSTYAWPGWPVSRFEMRIAPNTRTFIGPYTPNVQALDLLGERWQASLDLVPGNDPVQGAAQEAFFDRLKGPANLISMGHLKRKLPQGSIRDGGGSAQWKTNAGANATWQTSAPAAATWSYVGPTLYAAVAQLSNQLPISRTPGTTILAGDHFGMYGQLFRAMANATTDANGKAMVEVQPRARMALPISAAVTCTAPTANFMLKADGVPMAWRPGMFEGVSFDLLEVFDYPRIGIDFIVGVSPIF